MIDPARKMQLGREGARHLPAALSPPAMEDLERALASVQGGPGVRLGGNPLLADLLCAIGSIGRIAAEHLGPAARPVRALLFNKTEAQNWALGWHQDRTIPVRERVDTPGFSNWTIKRGIQHVEPPVELLGTMLTLRVHLDPVEEANAPLLIAPASHLLGRLPESEIASTVARLGSHACLAERGDIWLYATLILHASKSARVPKSRRVLQVDYSAMELPGGLQWAGI